MASKSSRSPVLYKNGTNDIVLIDIPLSIAAAQDRTDTILSTSPLKASIEMNEHHPRDLNKNAPQSQQHLEYKQAIQAALQEIRIHTTGPWCAPRKVLKNMEHPAEDMEIDDPEKELESRLREWAAIERKGDDVAFDFQTMMASLGATSENMANSAQETGKCWTMSSRNISSTNAAAISGDDSVVEEPWKPSFHNPTKHALALKVYADHNDQVYCFTIPPRSTFFLGDCTHSDSFRSSFRELTDDHNLPRHFDLVLLDPPWPNRSAKRKTAYDQVGGMPYLKKMLLKMDIDTYLENNALVGIWITNKKSLRDHVLGRNGLFERWNVGLIEEWIWVKTTNQGEPMFNIDDPMRKPYEVLLLGRAAPNSWTTMQHSPVVKRKVIAAVPDIHSRKPCLKNLLEAYLPTAHGYSAFEIFARYLVSGWTSWGNEVLKYNYDYYWATQPSETGTNG